MTRIAILSDIHGNLPALEACVADAERGGCAAFVNLGDIASGPLWPRETVDYLMARNWPTIAGNHERQAQPGEDAPPDETDLFARGELSDSHFAWFASLPADMTLPGGVRCHHARPGNDHEYLLENKVDGAMRRASDDEISERLNGEAYPLFLHGHSHLQRDVRLADRRRIVNPGSVGLPSHFAGEAWDDLDRDGPKACYAILDGLTVEMRRVAYDFARAADKAEAEGFGGWAGHLRHGRAR